MKFELNSKINMIVMPIAAVLLLCLISYIIVLIIILGIWQCLKNPQCNKQLLSGGYVHDNTNLCQECCFFMKDACCINKLNDIYLDCRFNSRSTADLSWTEKLRHLIRSFRTIPQTLSQPTTDCWPLNSECDCNCHTPSCSTINCCCFEINIQESPPTSPHKQESIVQEETQ